MNPKGSQEPCPIPMSYLESHYLSVFETTNDRILGECPLLHFTKMGKHPKSKSISKQTPSKKSDNVCKSTKSDRRKSKPTLQPIRQSLRLRQVDKQENLIEKQQEVIPQVYFGTASPFLQSVVLCHILENNFSLFEQIEMRRVCRLWHYNVKHIWAKTRSLVLEMKDEFSIKSKLSSDLDKQTNLNFNFEFDTTAPTENKVELTFGLRYWNNPTFDLLGDLFRNIEHLTMFYNINCTFNSTDQLCYLLQKFSKVKSFSLIIPKPAYVESNVLSKLFETIHDHLTQLHTLHIHFPNLIHFYNIPKEFPNLKKEHFIKTLSSLQNFSFNCAVENLGEMLKTMGQSTRIQSLGISIKNEKTLSPVTNLFKQNPNLSQIKRLKLTDVSDSSLNIVNSLIDHLPELECLYLNEREDTWIDFTTEWIQTLSKLPHLKELLLYDFEIQLLKDWMVKSLPTIRKLTIVESYCLRASIAYKYYQENEIEIDELVDPRLFYGRFLSCFAKQFPRLEQLTIRQNYDYDFDECFSRMCFTEFYHLKSLRLEGRNRSFTFTS